MSVCRHWWETGPCLAFNIITFNSIESFQSITSSYNIETLIHDSYTKLQTTSTHICHVTPHISSEIILLNVRCNWKDKQSLYFHNSWFILLPQVQRCDCDQHAKRQIRYASMLYTLEQFVITSIQELFLIPLLACIPPTAYKAPTVDFLGRVRGDWSIGRRSGSKWYFRASIISSWQTRSSRNKGSVSI
jgi:hypothetical protein